MSKLKIIYSGAPERSVLGQLLFILMINDLPTIANSDNSYLYADDIAVKRKEQK